MTDQPFPGLFVIGTHPIFFHKRKHDLQDFLIDSNSQRTVRICDDIMGSPRIEPGNRLSIFIRTERKLRLIPIPKGLLHPDDRPEYLRQQFRRKAADPLQISQHLVLLKFQLLFVGHLLDLTAAAFSGKFAHRLYPMLGRRNDLHQSCIAVILFCFCHPGFHHVADDRILNK